MSAARSPRSPISAATPYLNMKKTLEEIVGQVLESTFTGLSISETLYRVECRGTHKNQIMLADVQTRPRWWTWISTAVAGPWVFSSPIATKLLVHRRRHRPPEVARATNRENRGAALDHGREALAIQSR